MAKRGRPKSYTPQEIRDMLVPKKVINARKKKELRTKILRGEIRVKRV